MVNSLPTISGASWRFGSVVAGRSSTPWHTLTQTRYGHLLDPPMEEQDSWLLPHEVLRHNWAFVRLRRPYVPVLQNAQVPNAFISSTDCGDMRTLLKTELKRLQNMVLKTIMDPISPGSTSKRERDDMLARLRMLNSDCSCVQVCVARIMSFGRLLLLHAL